MRSRHVVRSLLVLMLILVPAVPALANSLASWVSVWPGGVSIDPLFGLLPTVLVSFVERPFLSRAGVRQRPLLRSIRANLLSLLAGIPVAMCVWSVRSDEGWVMLALVAVAISIVVEIGYLRSVQRKESAQLRWAWIVAGNMVSNLLLVGLAVAVQTLQIKYPELGIALASHQGTFALLHLTISFTMVTAALAEPAMRPLRLFFPANPPETVPVQPRSDELSGNAKPNKGMHPTGGSGVLPIENHSAATG